MSFCLHWAHSYKGRGRRLVQSTCFFQNFLFLFVSPIEGDANTDSASCKWKDTETERTIREAGGKLKSDRRKLKWAGQKCFCSHTKPERRKKMHWRVNVTKVKQINVTNSISPDWIPISPFYRDARSIGANRATNPRPPEWTWTQVVSRLDFSLKYF